VANRTVPNFSSHYTRTLAFRRLQASWSSTAFSFLAASWRALAAFMRPPVLTVLTLAAFAFLATFLLDFPAFRAFLATFTSHENRREH